MRSWDNLLNAQRFRPTTKQPLDARNEYERDYDRIVFCSAFRRLQDKAQVFPLERGDFVRTRLTHSFEVASLARSIGVDVARKLFERKLVEENYDIKFGNILSSASLIHDIGNPPFGHAGEKAISKWFDKYFVNGTKGLSYAEIRDFTQFEGNAQALRIVCRLQYLLDEYGLNLTYATLASLVKYPRASDQVDATRGSYYKKYGYFQSEKDRFVVIAEQTGLNGSRHPLTFLLEAADDIAYSAADVEDGVKKGALDFHQLVEILDNGLQSAEDRELIYSLIKTCDSLKEQSYPEPESTAVQVFRIRAQSRMLRSVIKVFLDNYEKIMTGEFDTDLISQSDSNNLYSILKNKIGFEYVYCSREVYKFEIVGDRVISNLLELFVPAMMGESALDKKLGKLISPNFVHVLEKWSPQDNYHRLRLVTDFIVGMTDSYALSLYQDLTGVKL